MKRILSILLVVALVLILLTSCSIEAVGAQSSTTSGSTSSTTAASSASTGWTSWIFIIVLIVVFVVLIIIPNKRREKKYKEMLSTVKVGSAVKTIGGIYGKIVAIKEDLVTIETGPDKAKIVFTKSAIATIENMDIEAEEGSKGLSK